MTAASSERLRALAGPRLTLVGRCLLLGTPVDLYYLDTFLRGNQTLITGRVLEVQMPSYTRRFGHGIQESHSLDIDPKFNATFTCDLADAPEIPSDYYDCFLVANTLQHVEALRPALQTILRVTKPGGTLFASAGGFLPLIEDGGDFWWLSAQGWRRLLADVWPGCEIAVESHGNCLVALAAMHGLALEELSDGELDVQDPRYPVLVTIRCRKAEGSSGR